MRGRATSPLRRCHHWQSQPDHDQLLQAGYQIRLGQLQDWGKYLGDVTMASTILDRLMHRCTMLEFEGKSYRLKEAAARLAISPEPS